MIVDCAHVSPDVMRQTLDISNAPIVLSHSNAKALCDHPRNVPDDVLMRLKANGGMVMATFVPAFISQRNRDWVRPLQDEFSKAAPGVDMHKAIPERERHHGQWPRATLEQLCDHIVYMAGKAGIDHIGIGSDFYGGPVPLGLENVSRFPHLLAELIVRGWSDGAIAKISGANFIRMFKAVEAAGRRLRKTTPPLVGRIEDFDKAATL